MIIKPQPGFQEQFLASEADIVIGGGAAGVGKTFSLLLEPLRHMHNKLFSAVCFRRTMPEIMGAGGLWDTSEQLYPLLGAVGSKSGKVWRFPSGAYLKFSHMEYAKDRFSWQGSQIPLILFDELTHFDEKVFWYLLGRNRSVSGVKPYVRATCNPDANSWVASFLSWWIDQETGFPIPERIGQIRYMTRDSDTIVWGDTKEEVMEQAPHVFAKIHSDINPLDLIKSVTFITGNIYDNKELMKVNPEYLSNLLAQDEEERKKLLEGNWKISSDGLGVFTYACVQGIFSNHVKEGVKCITVDVAGYGQDLAVIKSWDGLKVVRTDIYTRSSPQMIHDCIEARRKEYGIPARFVIVDSDGMGWGLSGHGYTPFNGGASQVPTQDKIEYANLKTQCYYKLGSVVNNDLLSIDLHNVYVDGQLAKTIPRSGKDLEIQMLIKNDLLAIKKRDPDRAKKKQINPKTEQKVILNGRSPDFGDALMMRMYVILMSEQPVEKVRTKVTMKHL